MVNDFKNLGYDSYYLIPGLEILAPLDLSVSVDAYRLNLFCCNPDTSIGNQGIFTKPKSDTDI